MFHHHTSDLNMVNQLAETIRCKLEETQKKTKIVKEEDSSSAEKKNGHGTSPDDCLSDRVAIAMEVTASLPSDLSHPCGAQEIIDLLSAWSLTRTESRIAVDIVGYCLHDERTLLQLATNADLQWYVREEALRCLILDDNEIETAGRGSFRRRLMEHRKPSLSSLKFDFDTITHIVGNPKEDAAVRTMALEVLVSHNHKSSLPHLQNLMIDGSGESQGIERWWDGERRLQLARAALGDESMYATAVVHCYDPQPSQRREARETLNNIAHHIGGMAEVGKKIILHDDLLSKHDINSTKPDLSSHMTVWKVLQEYHWNECVIVWATENMDYLSLSAHLNDPEAHKRHPWSGISWTNRGIQKVVVD